MNTISFLNPSDLARAWLIEKRCNTFFWNERLFVSNQGDGYLNYRINVNGVMAGFAITRLVADEATLFNIAVDPDYQRRGLARQLLAHLCEELIQRETVTLWLEVRESNAAARRLYQHCGFNEVTVRHDYYPTKNGRECAIVMALPLGF